MRTSHRPGDHLVTCDRTGRTVYASETRKEWTGAIVAADVWEPRHPQDFVRGRPDSQRVLDPRPEPDPVFQGPTRTTLSAAAAAGATAISVASTSGFTEGGRAVVMLEDGQAFRVTISSIAGTTLNLAAPLPGSAAAGAAALTFGA